MYIELNVNKVYCKLIILLNIIKFNQFIISDVILIF